MLLKSFGREEFLQVFSTKLQRLNLFLLLYGGLRRRLLVCLELELTRCLWLILYHLKSN